MEKCASCSATRPRTSVAVDVERRGLNSRASSKLASDAEELLMGCWLGLDARWVAASGGARALAVGAGRPESGDVSLATNQFGERLSNFVNHPPPIAISPGPSLRRLTLGPCSTGNAQVTIVPLLLTGLISSDAPIVLAR